MSLLNMRMTLLAGWILLALAGTVDAQQAAPAAAVPSNLEWSTLTPADREALLEPIRERWERATPEQRQRMLDRARFWASLSPEQKRMARTGADRYRQANQEQRGRLRAVWQNMQALPPAQREEMRKTWEGLTPQQRRAWLEAGGPGVAPPPKSE